MRKKVNKPIFLSEDERLIVQEFLEYIDNTFCYYDLEDNTYSNDLNHSFNADMIIKLRKILKEMGKRNIII